jgi:hypothetical protein
MAQRMASLSCERKDEMKTTTRIIVLAILLALSLGVMSTLPVANHAEAATVAVTLDAPSEVVTGASFQVNVTVSSITSFDAGQFDISYNVAVLQLDTVGNGRIGTTDIPVAIWNTTSPGVCRVLVNVAGVTGISGSGRLATLTFHAVGATATSSTIAVSNGFLNDVQASEIPATWAGDSVGVVNSIAIVDDSLPSASMGSAYSAKLSATGGNGTYTWSVSSGSLPSGISLSSNGSLSGTPTAAGNSSVTIGVSDGQLSTTKVFNIVVSPRLGDVNGDGAVNTADITKVERIIVGLDATTTSADANQDGKVNAADVTKVERIIAGLS